MGSQVWSNTFLGLPPTIREKIYSFAGLQRSCPIEVEEEALRWPLKIKSYRRQHPDISNSNDDQGIIEYILVEQDNRCAYDMRADGVITYEYPPDIGCIHAELPVELFRISKLVYFEAARVLYGKNIFILGPTTLQALPNIAYNFLTSLEIRLTSCSCLINYRYARRLNSGMELGGCLACHYYCRASHNTLSRSSRILSKWNVLCAQLKADCSTLARMAIICDCKDSTGALKIIQPLLKGFPLLKWASIRLGPRPNPELRKIAEIAVRQLTGLKQQPIFHLFQQLPSEIQELVLYHTDLIAPNYLSWNEKVSCLHCSRDGRPIGSKSVFRPFSKDHPSACRQCTLAMEVDACPSRHAASGSGICKDWDSPISLFLVSKEFSQKAVKIFFSQNRFVLWETTQELGNLSGLSYRPGTIDILHDMPTNWAAHIRWLRFCIPKFSSSDGEEGSEVLESWITLGKIIKSKWSNFIGQMTIELDIDNCLRGRMIFLHGLERQQALQSFRNIANTFQLAPGSPCYRDFFIRLGHYVRDMEADQDRWRLEKELEKQIMGEDYDAARRGKYRDSEWYDNEAQEPQIYKEILKIAPGLLAAFQLSF